MSNAQYQRIKRERSDDMQREGRAIADQWARQLGYADMTAALDDGRTYAELIKLILNGNWAFDPHQPPF